jgi:hypothetical protein
MYLKSNYCLIKHSGMLHFNLYFRTDENYFLFFFFFLLSSVHKLKNLYY